MTIYQRMAAIFIEAGIPGFLNEWQATDEYPAIPDKYCTYLMEREAEAMAADDEPLVTRYTLWVDIYGKTDVSAEQRALIRALRAGGFYIPYTRDLDNQRLSEYEYHRRMQVHYYQYDLEED